MVKSDRWKEKRQESHAHERRSEGHGYSPPDHVSTWDVGVRMGTAIRGAVAAISKDHGGTHANPARTLGGHTGIHIG